MASAAREAGALLMGSFAVDAVEVCSRYLLFNIDVSA